jgi:hypothetical protein
MTDRELMQDSSEERVQVSDKHRQKWVGLTDEEMFEIIDAHDVYLDMCRAVEAKIKEKNT